MSDRDFQRSKLYDAERLVSGLLERGGQVQVADTTLTLPPEAKFGDIDGVRRYVRSVIEMPSVAAAFGAVAPLEVVASRATTQASYSPDGHLIRIPDSTQGRWALREMVVLHEIAHHLRPEPPAHGPRYVDALATLTGLVMAPEVELLLRITFRDCDVKVGG